MAIDIRGERWQKRQWPQDLRKIEAIPPTEAGAKTNGNRQDRPGQEKPTLQATEFSEEGKMAKARLAAQLSHPSLPSPRNQRPLTGEELDQLLKEVRRRKFGSA